MRRLLARLWIRLWRWTFVPPPSPLPPKFVLIAAPHTSNWDFPLTLALAEMAGVDLHWLGKDALFKPPMGGVMKRLGGIPIDRSAPQGTVGQLAERFAGEDRLAIAVPAEGTRSRTDHWKSGFYHIAREAGVPIALAFVDKRTRTGGIGPVIHPSGDITADMDIMRAFYEGREGLKAGKFGPVLLREELEASQTADSQTDERTTDDAPTTESPSGDAESN